MTLLSVSRRADEAVQSQEEVETFIKAITSTLPATEHKTLFALWCASTAKWVGQRSVSFIPTSGTTELPSYSITLVQPQLLMGRHIWTSLPQSDDHLIPKWPYLQEFREQNQSSKEKQKRDFDRRH